MNPHLKTFLTSGTMILFYSVIGFAIACYVISEAHDAYKEHHPQKTHPG